MRFRSNVLFLLLVIERGFASQWTCTTTATTHSRDADIDDIPFRNARVDEQCTITVEYRNQQQERQVCVAHTLAITSLPPPSLSSNQTMQTFKLSSCRLSALAQLPFSLPSTVETLDLSANSLTTFLLAFPLPANLKHLHLDGNPDLIDVNFGNQRAQQHLIGLSLAHNRKMRLSALPPRLTHLDLTDCHFSQSTVQPLLASLTNLTHLSLANNQLDSLPSLDESVRLHFLNVSHNRLTSLDEQWLRGQLRTLDLRFNQVQSLEFLRKQFNLTAASNNNSSLTQNNAVSSTHSLQLWLHGNPLNCDCWLGAILDSSPPSIIINDLHRLQCHAHPIMNVSRNDLLCSYARHCASDCSCCDFEACDCHAVCPSECSCSHDAQWSRHLVKCPRTNLSHVHMLLPQTITELDYEGNSIEEIKPHVFIGKTALTKLNLARNRLQRLINETFCTASNLRELNLSDNPDLVVALPQIDQLFQCLKHLQYVILSRNQIDQQQQIGDGWMILASNDDNTVRLTRISPRSTVAPATSTLRAVLMTTMPRSTRRSLTKPVTTSPLYRHECTTFTPLTTRSTIARPVPFIQHNQTLIVIVFFLLVFVLLFLILLITLAICRRRLRRHLTSELQRQRSHHYYYHHARLCPPTMKTCETHGVPGVNDSLYEQLPSLSSDSDQPFLYSEKKSSIINAPAIPPHPPSLRHHFCCHPTGRLLHIPTTNSHEYQYATNVTNTTGCSTPTSQQHQCTAILLWANRFLYPTQATYNQPDCSTHSCPSELQHLQQCLLSNQQEQASITTESNVMRYCNNETLLVPTMACRCHGPAQNTDTYIQPHVHR